MMADDIEIKTESQEPAATPTAAENRAAEARRKLVQERERQAAAAQQAAVAQQRVPPEPKESDMVKPEEAKKMLAEDRKIVEEGHKQFHDHAKGKPTPTQEENDLVKLGASVSMKQDDGSGPPPTVGVTRSMGAGAPGAYQTRAAQPRQS